MFSPQHLSFQGHVYTIAQHIGTVKNGHQSNVPNASVKTEQHSVM